MTTPVSGSRAGEVHPSLDELAAAQGTAPSSGSTKESRTAASWESNTVTRAPASTAVPDAPREFPTGTMDYYRKRHFDFVDRNPGVPPPPYYLQYGDKYVQAFKALGSDKLSPEGLAWRDRALKGLQDAMENRRKASPAPSEPSFAELERDPQKFKEFAYDTHVDAYINAGLFKLPIQDLKTILLTPDFKDLLDPDGRAQIKEVAINRMHRSDVAAILAATPDEALRRNVQPTVDQIQREMKARMAQGWLQSGY
ncbi:hypothetical protein [Archangium lipolyticum]|uniref:hypothetical protein n=1 Tax=Archangium lipolyticum TaxID=2970465 RepID=UPI002149FBE3|nr:hypothetical protein [Archangium lipolyticum]